MATAYDDVNLEDGRREPGRIRLASLILAAGLASTAATAQQLCGGIGGVPCGAGEFCELPDGFCCCDFEGTCSVIPGGCPAIYDPVCGCDGATYSNRCEASRAAVSVDHVGACGVGPEVTGVVFSGTHEMSWNDAPGALAYNVYLRRDVAATDPPGFAGHCLLSALHAPRAAIESDPPADALWLFQVTAMYEGGEGSMGSTSQGVPRAPAAPCTCTLPADPDRATACARAGSTSSSRAAARASPGAAAAATPTTSRAWRSARRAVRPDSTLTRGAVVGWATSAYYSSHDESNRSRFG